MYLFKSAGGYSSAVFIEKSNINNLFWGEPQPAISIFLLSNVTILNSCPDAT